jgi:hypothetical protein
MIEGEECRECRFLVRHDELANERPFLPKGAQSCVLAGVPTDEGRDHHADKTTFDHVRVV